MAGGDTAKRDLDELVSRSWQTQDYKCAELALRTYIGNEWTPDEAKLRVLYMGMLNTFLRPDLEKTNELLVNCVEKLLNTAKSFKSQLYEELVENSWLQHVLTTLHNGSITNVRQLPKSTLMLILLVLKQSCYNQCVVYFMDEFATLLIDSLENINFAQVTFDEIGLLADILEKLAFGVYNSFINQSNNEKLYEVYSEVRSSQGKPAKRRLRTKKSRLI